MRNALFLPIIGSLFLLSGCVVRSGYVEEVDYPVVVTHRRHVQEAYIPPPPPVYAPAPVYVPPPAVYPQYGVHAHYGTGVYIGSTVTVAPPLYRRRPPAPVVVGRGSGRVYYDHRHSTGRR